MTRVFGRERSFLSSLVMMVSTVYNGVCWRRTLCPSPLVLKLASRWGPLTPLRGYRLCRGTLLKLTGGLVRPGNVADKCRRAGLQRYSVM